MMVSPGSRLRPQQAGEKKEKERKKKKIFLNSGLSVVRWIGVETPSLSLWKLFVTKPVSSALDNERQHPVYYSSVACIILYVLCFNTEMGDYTINCSFHACYYSQFVYNTGNKVVLEE